MVELFQNIGAHKKKEITFWIKQAFAQESGKDGAQMLMNLRKELNDEEKEFMDFAYEVEKEIHNND